MLDVRNKKLVLSIKKRPPTARVRMDAERAWSRITPRGDNAILSIGKKVYETDRHEAVSRLGVDVPHAILVLDEWGRQPELRTYAALDGVCAPAGRHKFAAQPNLRLFSKHCVDHLMVALALAFEIAHSKSARRRAVAIDVDGWPSQLEALLQDFDATKA